MAYTSGLETPVTTKRDDRRGFGHPVASQIVSPAEANCLYTAGSMAMRRRQASALTHASGESRSPTTPPMYTGGATAMFVMPDPERGEETTRGQSGPRSPQSRRNVQRTENRIERGRCGTSGNTMSDIVRQHGCRISDPHQLVEVCQQCTVRQHRSPWGAPDVPAV